MNKNNIDKNKLNGLLGVVSKKIGVSPEKLKGELEAGKFDSAIAAMSKSDADKFQQAIKNPKMVDMLISSPQAKAIYEKLKSKK